MSRHISGATHSTSDAYNSQLDGLVAAIRSSAKYRHLSEDLIRRIGARELQKCGSLKPAIQETRSALHQAAGAFREGPINYDRWRSALESANRDFDQTRGLCKEFMQSHASTRERLPDLGHFYFRTLGHIEPVQSVIDIACGLNPLSLLWMPLAADFRYSAYDIYEDMMEFLREYLGVHCLDGVSEVRDVVANPPEEAADLALVLKFLPVLEQIQRGGSAAFLDSLRVRYMLVSFPTRSLGGRGKGMAENYERRFGEILESRPWRVERFLFPNELCFLIEK